MVASIGCSERSAPPRSREHGAALILALFLGVLVAGLAISGASFTRAYRTGSEVRFAAGSQAVQFARSGLTEALNWFRRQPSQPVLDFRPQRDPTASPAILDTEDPDIGLVREFLIDGTTWGRYEVWRSWQADPDPDRLAWRRQVQCADVSAERSAPQQGAVWKLSCVGYVFERRSPTATLHEPPNRIVASEILETEIRRLNVAPPGAGALNVRDGNSAHVNTGGRVVGNEGAGITYPGGSGTPTTGSGGALRVTGTPGLSPVPGYDDSPEAVFGVGIGELRAMADVVVRSRESFPSPMQPNSLVFVEIPALHFDASMPLTGSGIVFVKGNVTLLPGNNSNFTGLLYIDGNLTVRAPCEIRGTVIATGNVNVQGAGDFATIAYDREAVEALMLFFGRYRISGAFRRSLER